MTYETLAVLRESVNDLRHGSPWALSEAALASDGLLVDALFPR